VGAAMTFDLFWDSYPRKVGKIVAEKSYAKAVKAHGAATIMSGLSRFNSSLPEKQFIPHPSTWLNQGRYLDPIDKTTGHNGFYAEDITKRWVGGRSFTFVDALGFRHQARAGIPLSPEEREAMRLWDVK